MVNLTLDGVFFFAFFEIEEVKEAEKYAKEINGEIFSYKTVGRSNWFEKRLSIDDVLGLAVLPAGLPDWIDLPDDAKEDGDEDQR